MPTSANTVIGYVVDVQGDLLVATLVLNQVRFV